jgi:hypothetical protein
MKMSIVKSGLCLYISDNEYLNILEEHGEGNKYQAGIKDGYVELKLGTKGNRLRTNMHKHNPDYSNGFLQSLWRLDGTPSKDDMFTMTPVKHWILDDSIRIQMPLPQFRGVYNGTIPESLKLSKNYTEDKSVKLEPDNKIDLTTMAEVTKEQVIDAVRIINLFKKTSGKFYNIKINKEGQMYLEDKIF